MVPASHRSRTCRLALVCHCSPPPTYVLVNFSGTTLQPAAVGPAAWAADGTRSADAARAGTAASAAIRRNMAEPPRWLEPGHTSPLVRLARAPRPGEAADRAPQCGHLAVTQRLVPAVRK